MTPERFTDARAILAAGISERAFPAASVEVGTSRAVLWRDALGQLTYEADARDAATDTIFDLASLTKVIATATLVMRAIESRRLRLNDLVGDYLPDWRGADRAGVTIQDLLEHASGLTAYLPFFRDHSGRREFERAICTMPLEYAPRSQSIYSDLGFMLLGFILEDVGRLSLEAQWRSVAEEAGIERLRFRPPAEWRVRTAPTEVDPWRGRLIAGEVHDENAWALGGVAAHSGLFGTASDVGTFGRFILQGLRGEDSALAPADTIARFATRTSVPHSSRALGWDTMQPTSSCGHLMSARAIGHTGFTGTTLWIDPERDAYVVLLTNRVHPTRDNDRIQQIRPAFHDRVIRAVDG